MTTRTTRAPKKAKTGVETNFVYFAPQAKEVFVAGNFNDWNAANTPLKKNKKGEWSVSLKLAPGRYEYRYLVDGSWQNDQRPVECMPNAFGSWNCVIQVQ